MAQKSAYQKLAERIARLRRQQMQREQQQLSRQRKRDSGESAIKRDMRTAREREQKEVRNFQEKTGTRSKQPRKTKYPTAAETRRAAQGPRKVKYPTAAETRAAAAARRNSSSSSSSSSSRRSGVSGNYSRSGSTSKSGMPDELVTREKPKGGSRLRADTTGLPDRLARAIRGAQEDILTSRGLNAGDAYAGKQPSGSSSKGTRKSGGDYSINAPDYSGNMRGRKSGGDYSVNAPDFSSKAAKAKRSGKKPDVDTSDYMGLRAPRYSSKLNDTQGKRAKATTGGKKLRTQKEKMAAFNNEGMSGLLDEYGKKKRRKG